MVEVDVGENTSEKREHLLEVLEKSDLEFRRKEDLSTAVELERPLGSSPIMNPDIEKIGIDKYRFKEDFTEKVIMTQMMLEQESIETANDLKLTARNIDIHKGKPVVEEPKLYVSRFPVVIKLVKELDETRRKFDDLAVMQIEGKWDDVPDKYKKYIEVKKDKIVLKGKTDLLGILYGYDTENIYYFNRER